MTDSLDCAVDSIWRYPIKSMAGEGIPSSDVTPRGLVGDRAYALVDVATNRAAVVRTWGARLLSYKAQYLEEPTPDRAQTLIRVVAPDGRTSTTADEIERHLSEDFGHALTLMTKAPPGLLIEFPKGTVAGKMSEATEGPLADAAPAGTLFDVAPIHLLVTSTLEHLQSSLPASQIDIRR